MRTTVIVDEKLLKKASDALGTKTIRDTIEKALEEVVNEQRRQKLLTLMRTMEIDLTQEELERWRAGHTLPD